MFRKYCHCLALTFGLLGAVATAAASPRLVCQVTYAGETTTLTATPVQDPYTVPAVDIRGRFRFKPVVVGTPERVERVLIYVYAESRPHPVMVQHARYLPPFTAPFAPAGQAQPLTGLQRLYAGPLQRELIYSCDWQEAPQ